MKGIKGKERKRGQGVQRREEGGIGRIDHKRKKREKQRREMRKGGYRRAGERGRTER